MTIRIEYIDGTNIVLPHVQTITLLSIGPRLLDGSSFSITCFGNEPVKHHRVLNLDIMYWGE